MNNKILSLSLFLFSFNVFGASTISDVTIKMIGYDKNHPNIIFIRTSKLPSTLERVACHTDTNWNYVLKLSSPLEEKMYTALLAAQASKQNLTLRGSGLCDAPYSVIESLSVVYAGVF